MASEQIFKTPRVSAAELRAWIDDRTEIGAVFSVHQERYTERRAIAELLWEEHARYELVAYYTDSVQLRRVG